MAPEELASAVRRRPFVPFRLTLTEGSVYEVRHPELCMPGRRSAVLGLTAPDASDTVPTMLARSWATTPKGLQRTIAISATSSLLMEVGSPL